MTRVVQRVGANGLQLPKELVERWGIKEGQEVIIELTRSFIRILPLWGRIKEGGIGFRLPAIGEGCWWGTAV